MQRTTIYLKDKHKEILHELIETERIQSLQEGVTKALDVYFESIGIKNCDLWPNYTLDVRFTLSETSVNLTSPKERKESKTDDINLTPRSTKGKKQTSVKSTSSETAKVSVNFTLQEGDICLVKEQTSPANNGLYKATRRVLLPEQDPENFTYEDLTISIKNLQRYDITTDEDEDGKILYFFNNDREIYPRMIYFHVHFTDLEARRTSEAKLRKIGLTEDHFNEYQEWRRDE